MDGDDDRTFVDGTRRRRILFWTLAVMLLGTASLLLFWPHAPLEPEPSVSTDEVERPASAERALQLYFADRDAQGLAGESRKVQQGHVLEEDVAAAISALVAGPGEGEHAAVLPAETRLQQTFFAESNGTLFLDFNSALVTRHPGGSTAEYLTLSALVRTVAANFPQVARLQILVDGQAIDTLAGHFDISKPIDIAEWQ